MTQAEFVRRSVAVVVIVAVTVFLMLAISSLLSILLLVFLCWVLSVGLNAVIHRLERRGMRRGIASLVTFLAIFAVIGLVIAIVVPPFVAQVTDLVEKLPSSVESLVGRYNEFYQNADPRLQEILPQFTPEDYDKLLETQFEDIVNQDGASGAIDMNRIISSAVPILGGIGSFFGSFLANTIFVILITAYLVADPLTYYRPIVAIVPKHKEQRVLEIINEIHENVIAWMGGLALSITFTSVAVTLALGVILRIPNAVALGVLSGLGTFIPNIGYYIGLIPIIIFTAAVDPAKVIPAAILYWLLNQFEASVVTPAVMKNELNIPVGVILPFQLIAASVMGFYGIVLAVPMLAIVITLVRELYVFDVLGKRAQMPAIVKDDAGKLHLEALPAEQESAESATLPAAAQ